MALLNFALLSEINSVVARRPGLERVVLQCSAINAVDSSALESLEAIDQRLRGAGLRLNRSEVKGPVMHRLINTELLRRLSGQVLLTHYQAIYPLAPEVA